MRLTDNAEMARKNKFYCSRFPSVYISINFYQLLSKFVNMKKHIIFIIAAFLLIALPTFADDWKILECSEKKVPQWVGSNPSGSLEVTAEGLTLEECRQQAQRELVRQIVMAVAANVDSRSLHKSSEMFDGDKVNSREEFDASTEITAARLPFIQGVSLSEATATYWVKLEDKKSKRQIYRLSILYPFPEDRLAMMRAEFERTDAEKAGQLKALKAGITDIRSAAQISEADATLASLQEYFFDAVRRKEARELQKQYNALYKSITISGKVVSDGVAEVTTMLNGHPFISGGRLKVTSDCASAIQATPEADGYTWRITYSTEDCLPLEQNTLQISMNIKTARLSLTLNI